jgi:hypothetical protein
MGVINKTFRYFERVGISLSVLFNVLIGGPSNQTFSARNYDWKKNNKPNLVWLIDSIFYKDSSHCLHCWTYWYLRQKIESKTDNTDNTDNPVDYKNIF